MKIFLIVSEIRSPQGHPDVADSGPEERHIVSYMKSSDLVKNVSDDYHCQLKEYATRRDNVDKGDWNVWRK